MSADTRYPWTVELHDRLVVAILPLLAPPNGAPGLSALDFASIGEVAQEIADAVEACWVPTEMPGQRNGKPRQMPLLAPILAASGGES